MRTRTVAQVISALGLTLGFLGQANAVPQLRLTTNTGDTITVSDGAAADWNSVEGVVLFSGPLGDWSVNVTTGVSKPLTDVDPLPFLDLGSLNIKSSGPAGSLTLELTDTGFGPLPGGAHIGSAIGGTAAGDVTFRTFFDASNQAFGQGVELTSANYASGAFSGTGWNEITALNPYSLTLLVTLTHDGRSWSTSSFDAQIQVPEPASLLLVGVGLLALGLSVRRRLWKSALV